MDEFDPLSSSSASPSKNPTSSLVRTEFDPLTQPNPLDHEDYYDNNSHKVPQQKMSKSAAPPTTPMKGSSGASIAPQTPGGAENKTKKLYSQYFRQYELLIEYKNLTNPGHCPGGMYVTPSQTDYYQWHGVLFLNQCGTVKFGENPAVIKFVLNIPQEYPERGPDVKILTHVFHPVVNNNGHVDLRHQFANWKPHRDHLCHVLHYLKAIFSDTFMKNLNHDLCPNREAFAILEKQPDRFAEITRQWAENNAHNDAEFEIKFRDLQPDEYVKAHKEIFKDSKTTFNPETDYVAMTSSVKAAFLKSAKYVSDYLSS